MEEGAMNDVRLYTSVSWFTSKATAFKHGHSKILQKEVTIFAHKQATIT